MIRFACVVGASIVLLAAARPGQAGLYIESLFIEAEAYTHIAGSGGPSSTVTSASDPSSPLGAPVVVQALNINGPVDAISYQSKDGYFRNRASIHHGSIFTIDASAKSLYALVVGTDMPDTPLVLDFQFLGAEVRGSNYFGFGTITAKVSQAITGRFISDPVGFTGFDSNSPIWSIEASVGHPDSGNMWNHSYDMVVDVQNIGVPDDTITPGIGGEPDGSYAYKSLKLELDAFNGTLDFGLLQPGEYFALEYVASAETYLSGAYDLGPEAYAFAELTDPFSLGGGAPPQLSLAGLTLPAVPEPSTGLLSLAAMAICAARRRGKDRGDRRGRAA